MTTDLKVALGLAVTLLIVTQVIDFFAIRLLFAVPLLFFLTGHVLLRAVGWIMPPLEHTVYAIGTSIALCVAGGFVLNMVSLLTPFGWACWILLVIGTGCWFARRRSYQGLGVVWNFPATNRWHHAGVAGIVLIVIGSYLLAIHDEAANREFKYTEFWMLPQKRAPGRVLVGIRSAEVETQRFDIVVTAQVIQPKDAPVAEPKPPAPAGTIEPEEDTTPKRAVIAQFTDIEVDPGDTWTHVFNVGGEYNKAEAKLYRSVDHTIYRRVSALFPKP